MEIRILPLKSHRVEVRAAHTRPQGCRWPELVDHVAQRRDRSGGLLRGEIELELVAF